MTQLINTIEALRNGASPTEGLVLDVLAKTAADDGMVAALLAHAPRHIKETVACDAVRQMSEFYLGHPLPASEEVLATIFAVVEATERQ
jgi:hypothetical protein